MERRGTEETERDLMEQKRTRWKGEVRRARRNGKGLEETERDLKEGKGTRWNGEGPDGTEGHKMERSWPDGACCAACCASVFGMVNIHF